MAGQDAKPTGAALRHIEEEGQTREWVAASRAGDAEAFGRLVERHQKQVYGYILRMTGREDVADDLTQEAFVAAWRHLDGYREKGPFAAWLLRIALNKVRTYGRWKRLRNWLSLDAPASNEEEGASLSETLPDLAREADPAASAADPNLSRRLAGALAGLPERQREVLLLRASGLALEEIAGVLKVAVGTVKATLFAAKKKLQEGLPDLA